VRNIELKARLHDLASARRVAERLTTKRLGMQHQVDTYFHCRHGRLKLREIDGLSAQLVWYARPDGDGPQASDYRLVPVSNPKTLRGALASALGVCGVVEKHREIFLYHNVRIHLDEVVRLGRFLEFEAVLGPKVDDRAGHAQLDELAGRFGIREDDLLSGSYGEMIVAATGPPPSGPKTPSREEA